MKWIGYIKAKRDAAVKRYGADVAVKAWADPVFKAFTPANGQPFQIEGYATTDAVDLEKEVILPEGIDWQSYFAGNRTMFVDHEYDVLSAVGKCRSLKLTARLYTIGHSVVVQRIESGKPTKEEAARYPGAVLITRKSKLIEISYTPIPMNGECQAYAVADEAAIVTQQPATKARRKIVILG
jgi:phage head maturation protease